ncbi:hypothetical protein [Ignatzschineria cameli]|uniref:hypothetical protein n=1 Tax=Ignatzschineria cameli TaxID=2182793 RepID=UPI001057D232|nr:hypothetical protein [Ignatzschineria cameli]
MRCRLLTIMCFHKLHAGKYRYFSDIILGTESAESRACTCYKNEIVGSRRSTDLLKNHSSTKQSERCRILLSYSSTNHVPAVGNHPTAKIVLVFIKADEVPASYYYVLP